MTVAGGNVRMCCTMHSQVRYSRSNYARIAEYVTAGNRPCCLNRIRRINHVRRDEVTQALIQGLLDFESIKHLPCNYLFDPAAVLSKGSSIE